MFFRPTISLLALTRGAFALDGAPRTISSARFSTVPLLRYKEDESVSSGYGDDGSPASAHPREQGAESTIHQNLEHPGPKPVPEGRPNTHKRDSPSYSSSFSGEEDGAEGAGKSKSNKPKISKGDSFGRNPGASEKEDVRKHNEHMGFKESDAEPNQRVDRKFWSETRD